jgi:dihydroxy-acid dehydratase
MQSMLYAAGVPDRDAMKKSPQVGIASVWWEGNPCNMHLLDLGKTVKKAVIDRGMIGWQYNTIGVSDAITMGNHGKGGFVLESIADHGQFCICMLPAPDG